MQLVQEIYISYIGAVAGRGFNGFILSNGENLDKNQWPGRETPFGVLEGTRSLFPNSNLLETIHFWLVGFNPFEKYSSNWIISPNRGENKNVWNHQLDLMVLCKEVNFAVILTFRKGSITLMISLENTSPLRRPFSLPQYHRVVKERPEKTYSKRWQVGGESALNIGDSPSSRKPPPKFLFVYVSPPKKIYPPRNDQISHQTGTSENHRLNSVDFLGGYVTC